MADEPFASAGYSSGVSRPVPRKRRHGRAQLIFAIAGVVLALGGVAAYFIHQRTGPPARSPQDTVTEFLSAVFLSRDASRVAPVVCSSWDPTDAVTRTAKEVPAEAHVSWDQFAVVASSDTKMTMRARLALRLPDDVRPSSYEQWRFSLVKEQRWRVCEARPFIA
jgi:hypothetical protein